MTTQSKILDSPDRLVLDELPETKDPDRSLALLVLDLARIFRSDFARRLKHLGLTHTHWRVLGYLYREDGQIQTELARQVDLEKAPLGRVLDKLEDTGWIERRPDDTDRRAKRVYLTEKMLPHGPELVGAVVDMYQQALVGMATEDRDRLIDLLLLMRGNMGAPLSDED